MAVPILGLLVLIAVASAALVHGEIVRGGGRWQRAGRLLASASSLSAATAQQQQKRSSSALTRMLELRGGESGDDADQGPGRRGRRGRRRRDRPQQQGQQPPAAAAAADAPTTAAAVSAPSAVSSSSSKSKKQRSMRDLRKETDDADADADADADGAEDSGSTYLPRVISHYLVKIPPFTRVYLIVAIGLSLANSVLHNNRWPSYLQLSWMAVLTKLQVWRLVTPFLNFGPAGISLLFSAQFAEGYLSFIEKSNVKEPEHFALFLLFGAAGFLLLNLTVQLPDHTFGRGILTYAAYVWSRLLEGQEIQMMGLFNLRAELLPWLLCLQGYITDGQFPLVDLISIFLGHLFLYLTRSHKLPMPNFLKAFFQISLIKARYDTYRKNCE